MLHTLDSMRRSPFLYIFVLITFLVNVLGSMPIARADEFRLPAPGVRVNLSPEFNPADIKRHQSPSR